MHIRKYIDQKTCEILMFSLVLSHLDYSNGILFRSSDYILKLLQKVQNWVAKLTLQRKKYSSSTQPSFDLHWLPIASRIKYKIILLVYNSLKDLTPAYLKNLLVFNFRRGGLRNNIDARKLIVPYVNNETFANRSFQCCWTETLEWLTNWCQIWYKTLGLLRKSWKVEKV